MSEELRAKAKELRLIADKQIENAKLYAAARQKAGEAESELKILLTASLKSLRGNKKNLGVEMACLMLMEDNEVARELFRIWTVKEAKYKGLEKLLEAYGSKLIMEQSLLKRQTDGEKWGV